MSPSISVVFGSWRRLPCYYCEVLFDSRESFQNPDCQP
jgi:hypothetical protein